MRDVLVDAASVGLELDDTRRLAVAAALVIRIDGNSGLVLGAWPEIMQQKKSLIPHADGGNQVVFFLPKSCDGDGWQVRRVGSFDVG